MAIAFGEAPMSTPKRDRPASTITLPAERIAQLRTLAETEGDTITEVIERWINAEIAAGRLPDILPNFEVTSAEGRVWLTVKDFTFPALTPAQAGQFADVLLEIAETTDIAGKKALFGEGADEIRVKVARKGRGILIDGVDVQTGTTVKASLTPGMARDLARIIRSEAAAAAKHFAEEE
jgi:hypothetical protein